MEKNLLEEIERLQKLLYCYQQVISKVNEGVILTDEDCIIVEFNDAKARMEKMMRSEVMGKVSWDVYSPYSNPEISEHKLVLDTGEPIINAYRPHSYVSDMPVYIHYSTYPVEWKGKTIGVFTVSRTENTCRELLYQTIEQKRSARDGLPQLNGSEPLAEGTHYCFSQIIGSSKQMKNIIREAQTVAALNAPVLIVGETGTGKEVLAQSIHNYCDDTRKFVAINCAAIPENLVESTLFGTEKGSYTGAVQSKGLFRSAENGTLFLDEINSMSLAMQAKLLRALQEQRVRPVGGNNEYPIRCRLITATNENLPKAIEERRFRADLFYRISAFCISIPPLRERKEDIGAFIHHFIENYNKAFDRHVRSLSPEAEHWMYENKWSGNTRELQNIIQNMVLRADSLQTVLQFSDIPEYALSSHDTAFRLQEDSVDTAFPCSLTAELDRLQVARITQALEETQGNMTQAAMLLGIGRQNLFKRMKRLSIQKAEDCI